MIGVYVQMNYQASGKQVATLERAMGLSDEVILYLTLKLDRVVAPLRIYLP
ncbi:30S ribosomal protein S6 (fragment) [Microcystis aeruginosa PCC 9809]|uniref:30S ribosomal protein S6 n=1 Tax=Microcystis aeruginosa PCC 9809 TaxID=1160285 RepID=I4I5Z2_MICAE